MSKKIKRNDPCPCGSGRKYKNCCFKKSLDQKIKTPTLTLDNLAEAAKFHLNTLASGANSTKKIIVKSIDMMNDILVVTFYPISKDSMGIKIEASQIIAYLSSFFDGEEKLGEFGITHFSVKGLDNNDDEIMYAISSKESAQFARNGQSVEWLTHTLFQDNTDENRLSQAKVKISRVEKGLRNIIIHVLKNRDGVGWWSNINIRLRESAEHVYLNKYGVTSLPSGNELIEYTFLPSLKKIILDNWNNFTHIFRDINIFTNDMDRLNIIRREESHNRIISPSLIVELEEIYKRLLGSIEQEIPGTIPNYLIENWRNQLIKIFDHLLKNMEKLYPEDRKDLNVMMKKFQRYRNLISELKYKLEGLTIPPNKKKLHLYLVDIITRSLASLDNAITASKVLNIKGIENAAKAHNRCMEELNDFKEKYLLSEM